MLHCLTIYVKSSAVNRRPMLDKQASITYNKHMTNITYEDYIAYLRKIVENYDKDMANQKLMVNRQQYEMAGKYLSEEGLKAHYVVFDELEN